MRRVYCLIFFLGLTFFEEATASHIVGGEFEIVHLEEFRYQINLVLYFDALHGNESILNGPNAELAVFPAIFSKRTNRIVPNFGSIGLLRMTPTSVAYTNPDCALPGELITLRLFYTTEIILPPTVFNEPEGYYIVWERCCRNYNIDNIISEDPGPNGTGNFAGQTFYLEFPPVVDIDGEPFVNSSPVLFPPLSDYACVGRLYYADFSGEDPDGDSIVYSKVDPLNTSSGQALPTPSPLPHGSVNYNVGFNLENIIPGTPSFNIDKSGLLTVRPTKDGLFVFAVRAEEFRDGIKIGEVRRDFQMLVLLCEDPGVKPELEVEDENGMISGDDLTVIFGLVEDEARCVSFTITDQDEGDSETLNIRWSAINFDKNINSIASVNYEPVVGTGVKVEVCFTECPPQQEIPFEIYFIAEDDACPLPLSDSLKLTVLITPPPNNPPELILDDQFDENEINELIVGDIVNLGVEGIDIDGDFVVLDLLNLQELRDLYGLIFETQSGDGSVSTTLNWETECSHLDENSEPALVDLTFVIADFPKCFPEYDTVTVRVNLLPPPNIPPILSLDTTFPDDTAKLVVGEIIDLGINGFDEDGDSISVDLLNLDELRASLGLEFTPFEGLGEINGQFSWATSCSDLGLAFDDIDVDLIFVVMDNAACVPASDTIKINVKVINPKVKLFEFTPANVFTPNGDQYNNSFFIPDLPNENCQRQFEGITIYNRWGREVFGSKKRNFSWDGGGEPSGIYYYSLFYTDLEYKGSVSLLR